VYRHWSPPAVDQLLLRGEWYTAYTPYQPEISQGTLQSIYEYQSLIAELVDLDVVSASHYDGGAATAEAALMTCRATRRARVLISRGVHPHYRATTRTYFAGGLELDEIPLVADGEAAGTTDLAALERLLADPARPVAGVIAAQPDFLGLLEPMPAIGALAHAAGALFVAVIEPVGLAVLAPPGAYAADIAAGEGQSLGIAPQYGGPYLGILACTDALVRQIPGRLVGLTSDLDGRRAFVMTLRAREQDIRRDKAASNICTNQALLALAASIYLATIGPHGLRDVAALGAARAGELEAALAAAGAPRIHSGPYLNEFAVRVPDARLTHRRLLDRGILAGLVLADAEPGDPSLADGLLVCATEMTTSGEIERFAEALGEVLGGRPPAAVEAGAGSDRRPVAGSVR
jgi:glycine dehydrogenase subunit 1